MKVAEILREYRNEYKRVCVIYNDNRIHNIFNYNEVPFWVLQENVLFWNLREDKDLDIKIRKEWIK